MFAKFSGITSINFSAHRDHVEHQSAPHPPPKKTSPFTVAAAPNIVRHLNSNPKKHNRDIFSLVLHQNKQVFPSSKHWQRRSLAAESTQKREKKTSGMGANLLRGIIISRVEQLGNRQKGDSGCRCKWDFETGVFTYGGVCDCQSAVLSRAGCDHLRSSAEKRLRAICQTWRSLVFNNCSAGEQVDCEGVVTVKCTLTILVSRSWGRTFVFVCFCLFLFVSGDRYGKKKWYRNTIQPF